MSANKNKPAERKKSPGHILSYIGVYLAVFASALSIALFMWGEYKNDNISHIVKGETSWAAESKPAYSTPKETKQETPENSQATPIATTEKPSQTTPEYTITTTTTPKPDLPETLLQQRHEMYKDNIVIVGDSIASGFALCGYIPIKNSYAKGNIATWNIHDYTFKCGGRQMDITDAIAYLQPAYIYMSMGMNDVNMISEEEFVASYQKEIENFLKVSPRSNIVVASITPITLGNKFTSQWVILAYNEALHKMVNSLKLDNVKFFDAYSLLCDPLTLGLNPDYAAEDGIHIFKPGFIKLLNGVLPIYDTMPYTDKCKAAMKEYLNKTGQTEATTKEPPVTTPKPTTTTTPKPTTTTTPKPTTTTTTPKSITTTTLKPTTTTTPKPITTTPKPITTTPKPITTTPKPTTTKSLALT